MAVDAATIQTDGGGESGASGLFKNWRVLAIGGGVVLALVVVLIQRGKSSGSSSSDSGGELSTSANIALGQIAFDQTRLAGEESIRDAALLDALKGGIGGILAGQQQSQEAILGGIANLSQEGLNARASLETMLGGLSSQQSSNFDKVWQGILGLSQQGINFNSQQSMLIKSLSWQIMAAYDPAAATEWFNRYQADHAQWVGTGAASGDGQTSAAPDPSIVGNIAGG